MPKISPGKRGRVHLHHSLARFSPRGLCCNLLYFQEWIAGTTSWWMVYLWNMCWISGMAAPRGIAYQSELKTKDSGRSLSGMGGHKPDRLTLFATSCMVSVGKCLWVRTTISIKHGFSTNSAMKTGLLGTLPAGVDIKGN